MPLLTLKLELELEPPAYFFKWLPLHEDEAIKIEDGPVQMRFTVGQSREKLPEDVARTTNNIADRLVVQVETDVSQELKIIIEAGHGSTYSAEYYELGAGLQKAVVSRANRLIGFLRVRTGQYWLSEIEQDAVNPGQFFYKANTVATLDSKPFHFNPDQSRITIHSALDSERIARKESWPEAQEFVAGHRRLPLIHLLFANAHRLASQGLSRNALIDAVTALEIALFEFADNASPALDLRLRSTGETPEVMRGLIRKLGVRNSLAVGLPILLTEAEMPADLIIACKEAVDLRNNLIHNGQTQVKSDVAETVRVLEQACLRLSQIQ